MEVFLIVVLTNENNISPVHTVTTINILTTVIVLRVLHDSVCSSEESFYFLNLCHEGEGEGLS